MLSQHVILKVLVGSQAHGLAGPDSDADYRSVFVMPTAEMFRLGFKYQGSRWSKGEEDETSWEVGQFLSLGTQSHPLVLEALLAPVVTMDDWGAELRTLFPALWAPRQAYEAFIGYSLNQRRKFLEKKRRAAREVRGRLHPRLVQPLRAVGERDLHHPHQRHPRWPNPEPAEGRALSDRRSHRPGRRVVPESLPAPGPVPTRTRLGRG